MIDATLFYNLDTVIEVKFTTAEKLHVITGIFIDSGYTEDITFQPNGNALFVYWKSGSWRVVAIDLTS